MLCFIGESFDWLKALSPSKRAISFLIKGKLNPKKVIIFSFYWNEQCGERKTVALNYNKHLS